MPIRRRHLHCVVLAVNEEAAKERAIPEAGLHLVVGRERAVYLVRVQEVDSLGLPEPRFIVQKVLFRMLLSKEEYDGAASRLSEQPTQRHRRLELQ